MNSLIKRPLILIAPLLLVLIQLATTVVLSSCASASGEGFAIYLTEGDIPPANIISLSDVHITGEAIIGMGDVVSYNQQTHELKVSESAFKRIYELQVPVRGTSFTVCLDRKPVYWGAFWTPVSSISYDGVTIWKPYNINRPYILTLELGYPTASFYNGKDPRNDPGLMKVLEKHGKLISKLSIDTIERLPASMKEYELYSWQQANIWNYTLITGTNRNKTTDEIVSGDDFISEAGWVRIHVTGTDALNKVMGKLPPETSVFWLSQPRSGETSSVSIDFDLPPEEVTRSIKEYCNQHDIDLVVASST
jgi:hypothetical protein